jgi:hypothetical protein
MGRVLKSTAALKAVLQSTAGRPPGVVQIDFSCMPDAGQANWRIAGWSAFCESGSAGPLQQAFTWRGNSYSARQGLSMRRRGVIFWLADVHVYILKNPFTYTFKLPPERHLGGTEAGSGNRFPGRIPGESGRPRSGAGRVVALRVVCLDHARTFPDGVVPVGGQVGD